MKELDTWTIAKGVFIGLIIYNMGNGILYFFLRDILIKHI